MSKQPILILALALVTLVGCGPSADIPSDLEARAFLQNLVQVAQAGDMDRLCQLANCLREDRVNPPVVPNQPPTVVRTFVLEPGTTPEGQSTIGGRVLVLCGLDADSRRYQSELLVFRANGDLHTSNFKYWMNFTVGGSPNTPPEPPAPPECG